MLYAILGTQLLLTALLLLRDLGPSRKPGGADPSPRPRESLRSPSLSLRPGAVLRGAPVSLSGEAPDGEFVAFLVDGQVVDVTMVKHGRFVFDEVPLQSGDHVVSVIAYHATGIRLESPRVMLRYQPPPEDR